MPQVSASSRVYGSLGPRKLQWALSEMRRGGAVSEQCRSEVLSLPSAARPSSGPHLYLHPNSITHPISRLLCRDVGVSTRPPFNFAHSIIAQGPSPSPGADLRSAHVPKAGHPHAAASTYASARPGCGPRRAQGGGNEDPPHAAVRPSALSRGGPPPHGLRAT
jgi:hypothetical protein